MKKRIAIISVLKPVDDPRNYKKIGISLAETNKYEVNIIGHACKNTPTHPNIRFHPVFSYRRLNIRRIFASWKIYKNLIKVKPDLIISNTHELLIVILLYKILFGSKIVYDIQENYYENIRHSKAFPWLFRRPIALYVRVKERLVAPFIDHFLFAERCYLQQLPFATERSEVVENKYISHNFTPGIRTKSEKLRLAYTGTIAEEYGVFDALTFTRQLIHHIPQLQLTIAGFCHSSRLLDQLQKEARENSYINILGGDKLVPHNEILKVINESDFAILPYRLNTYYSARIPTKVYECLSLKTPMIAREQPAWKSLFDEFDAFVFTDFKTVDQETVERILRKKFYTRGNVRMAHWQSEKSKLIAAIEKALQPEQPQKRSPVN